jgi:hypothetical protein
MVKHVLLPFNYGNLLPPATGTLLMYSKQIASKAMVSNRKSSTTRMTGLLNH